MKLLPGVTWSGSAKNRKKAVLRCPCGTHSFVVVVIDQFQASVLFPIPVFLAPMNRLVFINLPVADLPKSMAFFNALGFAHNPQFTDDTAACIVISDVIHVMLLTHAKYREFTPREICDTRTFTQVLNCLSCESRAEVEALVAKALAAGGSAYAEPKDYGFMYQHSFADPDGHQWELIHMSATPGQPIQHQQN